MTTPDSTLRGPLAPERARHEPTLRAAPARGRRPTLAARPARRAARLVAAALALGLLVAGTPPTARAAPQGGASAAGDQDGTEELDTRAIDQALDRFWKRERDDVRAVYNPKHPRKGRHAVSLYSGAVPTDQFFVYFPIGGRWNYYFHDNFATEVWGSYLIRMDNDLNDFLNSSFQSGLLEDVPAYLTWAAGADILWSPIQGKLGIFTSKLVHFDIHLGAGLSVLGSKNRVGTDEDGNSITDTSVDLGANLALGFRFFVNQDWSIRVDYRQHFYNPSGNAVRFPGEINVGATYWIQ